MADFMIPAGMTAREVHHGVWTVSELSFENRLIGTGFPVSGDDIARWRAEKG